tara:strand:- start:793 stop:3087 length:2295 start_codon:yes stop_codon:yes gene_type:complete
MAKKKASDKVREIYKLANNPVRTQWEYANQRGYEFAHDEQLSNGEKASLEQQGMPTFTINRISPVVEMLNFYATANNPRWQAVGIEGSDIDVASVFSDLADYIWSNSNGDTLYSNAINDCITKSVGYVQIAVDANQDNGMGEVVVHQPEPFDIYVDPKSRDLLFKDAAFILIRKVLPKNHLKSLYPDMKTKISKAGVNEGSNSSLTSRALGDRDQKLFMREDPTGDSYGIDSEGEVDQLIEFFELYEKVQTSFINVFYRIPPTEEELAKIKEQHQVQMQEMQQEMQVQLLEQQRQMEEAVAKGEMLPDRYKLEMEKAQKMMEAQLEGFSQELMSKLQAANSRIENRVVPEKDFKLMEKDKSFAKNIVDTVQFYSPRIKQTCVAGDQLLYEKLLPDTVIDYPIIPLHFKWTGTPYPISAVSPLVGKQQEINKSHQIMVHNASLGSSLRWMYEEGSIDNDTWEKYSSAPGALLPIRPGVERPTPVMPAPLSNAFFSVVQQGKSDMEYLAGIYSSMMGDTQNTSDTFRGMLASDEYGTRRIKQWMKSSIEPSLRQVGEVIKQFSQSTYTANKRFRIIQPSAIQEGREQEINIPIYNDMGQAIGKSMDLSAAKFDVKIISGSTLPVNRWAYLEELKQLMQLGVVDDIAVLAETDIRNKEKIAKRKSLYSQLQGQISQMDEAIKDKEGTIETLERQLVQAGIKNKVMQASVEINKKKEEVKGDMKQAYVKTEGEQKLLRDAMATEANSRKKEMAMAVDNFKKSLETSKE